MLVNNNPGEIVRPVSTVGTQGMRPKLTIVLAGGAAAVQVTVSPGTATVEPGGQQAFTAVADDGHVTGTIPVTQTAWGIKPYRGLMGALKVRDDVEVVIDARLAPR